MKYILGIITTLLIILSFTNRKCDHVFTQVEQSEIKVERPSLSGSIIYPIYSWPTGLQEGKDLICVKCFHKQKQILDYGQSVDDRTFPSNHTFGINHLMDTIRIGLCCPKLGLDSVLVTGSGGLRYVNGDSILGRR